MCGPEHCLTFLFFTFFTLFFGEDEYDIANWCKENYGST